jgi:DNA-binding transcriptional regulator YiaG
MGKRVAQKQKDQFARELKAWRERRRFTQAEAAEFLGVPSVRTLQNWEIGRTRPVGLALALLRDVTQR